TADGFGVILGDAHLVDGIRSLPLLRIFSGSALSRDAADGTGSSLGCAGWHRRQQLALHLRSPTLLLLLFRTVTRHIAVRVHLRHRIAVRNGIQALWQS